MSSSYRLDSLFGMSQNCFQQMRNALHSYARRVKSLDIGEPISQGSPLSEEAKLFRRKTRQRVNR